MNALLQQLLTNARRTPFLVFCVTFALLCAIANYFLWQRQQEITSKHEEVRRSGESMFSALAGHSRIVLQLDAINDALKQIDDNLIVETDLAENLGYFYQLETLSRVRLTQLTQLSSQPADGAPYKAVPFSVRVTGTYPQLMGFVRELETGPRLLRIKTFDFSRADAKTSAVSVGLTVEVLAQP